MPDAELEQFKTGVNLSEFAAARGYALDRRESSKSCAVMRRQGNGDKIAITLRKQNGHWVYYNWHDEADSGSIIDFVQRREGCTLGRVRVILRPWVGGSPRPVVVPLAEYVRDLLPVSHDPEAVRKAWDAATVCFGLPYLTGRGLAPNVFLLPRFGGCLRVSSDIYGNALFPHYNRQGVCGFEIKNSDFTGFAPGGMKGLWYSKTSAADRRLVLSESAIDGLSFHLLQGDEQTRYMSTGGKLGPQQPALLRGAMEKLPKGGVVLLAFDHDEGGEKLTAEVEALAPSGRELRRVLPDVGKDWNEMLKYRLGLA